MNVLASVLMPVMFVKKHSVGSLTWRVTSLYIVTNVLMPVMFVKNIQSEVSHEESPAYT